MNALHRLQFQLMQDEFCDRWHNFLVQLRNLYPQRQHRVGISLAEASQESEGRVWVEVGNEGLRLRVSHLHPANPSVAETLRRKCSERRESQNDSRKNSLYTWLTGKLIYPPEEDKISLSSLEDYWFNHWQGPFITADNNQNNYSLSKLRRSHRKSRRTNRCSICHKKRVAAKVDDNNEGNILAHMPSVKLDARTLKDELEDKSEDEASEDALSRYSASDEHLSRAHRILDNELRTSFNLFAADEAVSQDVIDANVSMKAWDEVSCPNGSNRFFNSPPSPRQSRSCPCSPKLSARTCSPELISNSPKSRSFIGSSKFSLSSSLLAIHRQASNTIIPEFLKFDYNKSDSPGASKANSQQNSLRLQNRRHRHSLSESTDVGKEDGLPSRLESHTYPIFPSIDDPVVQPYLSGKRPIAETQSLPTLRLCKMTLTYRGGVIISEEKEGFETEDLEETSDHGAIALPITNYDVAFLEDKKTDSEGKFNSKKLLPDVVPDQQMGSVNLGFDGTEETSDFIDINIPPTHEFLENQYINEKNVPETNSEIEKYQSNLDDENLSESTMKASNLQMYDSCSSASMSQMAQNVSSCVTINEQFCSVSDVGGGTLDGGQYNTFVEKDVMQEARDMVFWWRKKSLPTEEELEFCLHEAECKVKQKPLLLFLHGIGSSADVWNQQLWYFLSCGYEVVAPDLLGHGMSSAPKDKKYYSFASMLDYISLVFDLFIPQGRKCIVIGHNYGCALAVALARGRPLSVGLVILASCGGPSPLAPYSKYESSLNSWVTRLLKPYISCGCLSRELLYTPRGKHFMPVISDEKGVPATPAYVIDNISSGQYWPEGDLAFHRRITIPTLLLHGMKDNSISFVEMCEMEKTIPRAFLELIPGAGHELMTDSAEEVCHAIHRFIRRWKNHI